MNLAAIDVGSNAARVLIMAVEPRNNSLKFQKLKLLRYPLRLGVEVFLHGHISTTKTRELTKMLRAFKLFMQLYNVEHYMAFATSAMREAANGAEVIKGVKNKTQIDLKTIDGLTEASILYQTHFEKTLSKRKGYIYVDVGGGSTEASIFTAGKLKESQSFKIGTLRMLHELVGKPEVQVMTKWIKKKAKTKDNFSGIASGGNINSIFQLSKKQSPISLPYLKYMRQEIKTLTIEERMARYSFKPDRAEVIIPALNLYIAAFKAAGVTDIYVPKIGLADGMVRILARKIFQPANT